MIFLESIWQDVRFAIRTLRKNVVISVAAVVTLALGIGINTGIFTVVNAILLRSLPFKDSDRLVWIWSVNARAPLKQRVSYPDILDWRAQSRSFEEFVGWNEYTPILTGVGEPQRLQAELTMGNLFSVLGVPPVLGTLVEAEKDRPQDPSVVLSYSLWRRAFNSDPNVIGRRISLDGLGYTVTAVMPSGFQFPIQLLKPREAWVRVQRFNPALANRRDARLIEVMARLKPGVTLPQAQAEMDAIASSLSNQFPNTNTGMRIQIVPAKDEVVGRSSLALLALLGAVACVLSIACVNVANLQLARAVGRRQEIVMRMSLGASRARITQQLVIESMLIGIAGGILGAFAALWSLDTFKSLLPADLPRVAEISMDWRVLAFTTLISLASGFLFGIAPAWQLSGIHLSQPRSVKTRVSGVLVASQIAFAMVLLTGAGLFAKSFWRLNQPQGGFEPHQVLTFGISLPSGKYRNPAPAFEQIQARLRAIPTILAASVGLQLPDRGAPIANDVSPFFEIEGRPFPAGTRPRASILRIQPNYFRTMGIPLLKGRDFNESDRAGAPAVTLINDSLARTYFPAGDSIGKHLSLDSWVLPEQKIPVEIIGVVGDVKHSGVTTAQPLIYAAMSQFPRWDVVVSVKTAGDPLNAAAAVRDAIRSFDKDLPVDDIASLDSRIAQSFARERFTTLLVSLFSIIAIVLAAAGLYGVLSYATARRTREIGVRIAIGAQRGAVLKLVLGDGLKMASAGLVLGILGALALTRLVRGLLFNVAATDPITFILAGSAIFIVACLASWIPARRAATVDPTVALRHE